MRPTIIAAAIALLTAANVAAVDWNDPQSLVVLAQSNHPTLARLDTEATAARERVHPAGAQPNPMLMSGIEDKMVTLQDDEMMTMYMVGVSQTFVRRGKRDARRGAAEAGVVAAELQLASARAEIERDVLFAWYDVAAIDSQLATTESVRLLIDAIVDAARVRYEVGSAAQADVIRGQLAKSALDHQIIALRGDRSAAAAGLLSAAGLPLATDIPTIRIARSTARLETEGNADVPRDHPAVAALQAEVAAREEQIKLARIAARPDVNIEAQYGFRRTQQDMFSVVASIELPLRRANVIDARVREAIALRDAAQRRIEELRRTLARDLGLASAAHDTANHQLDLHEQVLVPQARLAFQSTLAAYQSGKSSLEAVFGAESTYLRLQLDYDTYLATHIKAIRDFEAIRRGARFGAIGGGASPAGSGGATTASSTPSMGGMQP